ncbi:MAG: pyridoxamine 5'-phosphate oxidase family protein [Thermoproteota archaeon]|nr:pyridoxamine 5'-phosphate oxidase family protein [Thermoproteota archaeon]
MTDKNSPENNIKFSDKEIQFLDTNEVCRVATVSPDNIPHVIPVSYIFIDSLFFFATDYNTRKYRNLKENKNVALVIDIYDSTNNRAVAIQGTGEFIERGEDFKKVYDIFNRKFEWVRQEPWNEGEAPFVAVKPFRKISWGLE